MITMTDAAAGGILHDGVPTTFPATAVLQYRTGAPPGANLAPTGTLVNAITLPVTPWGAISGRTVPKSAGVWQSVATASGVVGYYRLITAADGGGISQTDPRIEGTVGGPVAGVGTVSAAAGTLTFNTSQVGALAVGYKVIVAGVSYTVLTFNGTTSATVSGAPTFGASAFLISGGSDLMMDNTNVVAGQAITENSFAVSA